MAPRGVLIAVLMAGIAGDGAAWFDRRPYLQRLTDTSVMIVSQSAQAVAARLRYDTTPALTAASPTQTGPASNDHVFVIEGLAPDTAYWYEVEHQGVQTFPAASFRTLPPPGAEFAVAALGDSGMYDSPGQAAIAAAMGGVRAPLLLHMGDIATPAGIPDLYQDLFFAMYAELLGSTCVYPALGNHDCFLPTMTQYWLDVFHTPANNPSADEMYYSFDAGDAHFAVLNSCAGPAAWAAQLAWLDADLAAASRAWSIVYCHHPPYASGNHGGSLAIRAGLCPVVETHGVDLVLSGHEHLYERTYPLADGWVRDGCSDPVFAASRGTIYAVTGGGGATLYECAPGPDAPLIARCVSAHHFLVLAITPESLTVRAIDRTGAAFDTFEIRAAGTPAPLSFIRGDANNDGAADLGDAVAVLSYLFRGSRAVCLAASDVNASGDIGIADAVYLLGFLFAKGPAPPAPYPAPGGADGADGTGCTCP